MDSNKLKDNWREKIKNLEEFRASKRFSVYRWENHDDKVRSYEDNDDIEGDHDDLSDESDIDVGPNIPDLSDRNLPKRIICFSSQKLLKLFSKFPKSSVDGTFKSSSVLWSQQFIWMIKEKHSWIPAIWGWLPDKTEQTYKVFFLLVQEKLAELNLSFHLKSVISYFELDVMKAIDDILDVEILGCFFI